MIRVSKTTLKMLEKLRRKLRPNSRWDHWAFHCSAAQTKTWRSVWHK